MKAVAVIVEIRLDHCSTVPIELGKVAFFLVNPALDIMCFPSTMKNYSKIKLHLVWSGGGGG